MTRKLICLAFFVTVFVLHGSGASSATIPPDIKKAVTFIFLADPQGSLARNSLNSPEANGTGFFVGVASEKDPSRVFGYLVTAKHVLRDTNDAFYPRVFLRLNKKDGDAQFIPLDLTLGGHSVVATSPDPTVDIAVVPVMPREDVFDFKMVPAEMLTTEETFQELHISEGSDVFFAGLFVSYYGEHRNNPIVRFGRVAMLPEDRILWSDNPNKPPEPTRLYLVEAQSYGGNSGSPVFFSLGSDRVPGSIIIGPPVIKLAGIMKGYFGENSPIRFVQSPTAVIPYSSQNNGIAAVIPSYLLHDILFSPDMRKARADYEEPAK